MVREALLGSVAWTRPPVRFQSSQVSMVPKARRPARSPDVFEDPLQLCGRKIGVEDETGAAGNELVLALGAEAVTDSGGATVLPHDGVVNGLAGLPIPDHRGFPLIGDADGVDVRGLEAGLGQDLRGDAELCRPDGRGIVLDPAGLGKDLGEFLLGHRDRHPGGVEENGAGRSRPLVEGEDVGHGEWER
jgi:hypothetical protein